MSYAKGLEGVVAARSAISTVDGEKGFLSYRGIDINELARDACFEEVVFLLWEGRLPRREELESLSRRLAGAAALPEPVVAALGALPKSTNPMVALRTGMSMLAAFDPTADRDALDLAANRDKAVRILAQTGAVAAAFERVRGGAAAVPARPDLSFAANFLLQFTGRTPGASVARVFDRCLVLHAEHELNASTFAARVTVATLSDLHSGIVSAIGTLKGPLHGGANTDVMRMLEAVGEPAKVPGYLEAAFQEKRKIPGFGHRVYKTTDPRAAHLKDYSRTLAEQTGDGRWYAMSIDIERIVTEKKKLPPNVDFYSASTYFMLGIPPDQYTAIFAVSRSAGWIAHMLEQLADNRLIRPRAEYVGPTDRHYVPVDQR